MLRLFWKNYGVLIELNHDKGIQFGKSLLVQVKGGIFLLIIKIGQKNGFVQIILMLTVAAHVVGGPQRLLNQFVVRIQQWEVLHFRKNLAPELALMPRAVGSNLHAVVWTANGDKVANWEQRVAGLSDEAANEGTLRNSDNIELSFAEDWMLKNLFAGLFRLLDH